MRRSQQLVQPPRSSVTDRSNPSLCFVEEAISASSFSSCLLHMSSFFLIGNRTTAHILRANTQPFLKCSYRRPLQLQYCTTTPRAPTSIALRHIPIILIARLFLVTFYTFGYGYHPVFTQQQEACPPAQEKEGRNEGRKEGGRKEEDEERNHSHIFDIRFDNEKTDDLQHVYTRFISQSCSLALLYNLLPHSHMASQGQRG